MVVVLPAPLGPTKPYTLCSGTLMFRWSRTTVLRNRFERSIARKMSVISCSHQDASNAGRPPMSHHRRSDPTSWPLLSVARIPLKQIAAVSSTRVRALRHRCANTRTNFEYSFCYKVRDEDRKSTRLNSSHEWISY